MYQVCINATSVWATGGNCDFYIKNTTTSEIKNWSVKLNLPITIGDIWNVVYTKVNNVYTFTGPTWKTNLLAGEEIKAGFVYSGASKFTASTVDTTVKLVDFATKNNVTPTPVPVDPTPVPTPTPTPVPTPTPTPVPTPVPVPVPVPTPAPDTGITQIQTTLNEPNTGASILNTNKKVFGYYTQWDMYGRSFNASAVNGDQLTHLLYAFFFPNPSQADYNLLAQNYAFPPKPFYPSAPEGSLAIHDEYAFNTQIANIQALKIKYPHLHLGISVGGWTLSYTLSKVMANAMLRSNLVKSSVAFMLKYGFDTFDLDWEYPKKIGISYNYVSDQDDSNLTLFFKELRAEMDAKSPNKYLEITCAIGVDPKVMQCYVNSVQYLDYINLMCYDYSGDFSDPSYLAAIYPNPLDSYATNSGFYTDLILKNAKALFPSNKLCVGVPNYGRGWSKVVQTNPSLPLIFGKNYGGSPPSLGASKGIENGYSSWCDLEPLILNKTFTEYWDSIALAPWCTKPSTGETWTYDNPKSMKIKGKYICDQNIAGSIVWELGDDLYSGKDNLVDALVSTFVKYDPKVTPAPTPTPTPVPDPTPTPTPTPTTDTGLYLVNYGPSDVTIKVGQKVKIM